MFASFDDNFSELRDESLIIVLLALMGFRACAAVDRGIEPACWSLILLKIGLYVDLAAE